MLLSSVFLVTVVYVVSNTATIAPAVRNTVTHVRKSEFKIYNSAHLPKANGSFYNLMDNKTSVMTFVKHINTSKRKGSKKYPKRTIQKIIKKSKKNKINKMLLVTSPQTEPTPSFEKEEFTTTTQAALKKKPRKWNSKLTRYPLPFHKLNARKDLNIHHKMKREVDDLRDVFVLQDLDEIEVLSNKDGTNVVRAHMVRPW